MATEMSYVSPKVIPGTALLNMGNAWNDAISDYTVSDLMAYQNDVAWTPNTNVGSLTECTFGGYARITGITPPEACQYDAADGVVSMNCGVSTFSCTGGPANTVYGAAWVGNNGGVTATITPILTSGVLTGLTITNGGTKYEAPPPIAWAGTHTTFPVVNLIVTNGVITGYTIVSGGSGLSGLTGTVQAPISIIWGGPFGSGPKVVGNPGDFLNVPIEVLIPPITNG